MARQMDRSYVDDAGIERVIPYSVFECLEGLVLLFFVVLEHNQSKNSR